MRAWKLSCSLQSQWMWPEKTPTKTTGDHWKPLETGRDPRALSATLGECRRQAGTPVPSQQHQETAGDYCRQAGTPVPSQQHQESAGDCCRQAGTPVPPQRHFSHLLKASAYIALAFLLSLESHITLPGSAGPPYPLSDTFLTFSKPLLILLLHFC